MVEYCFWVWSNKESYWSKSLWMLRSNFYNFVEKLLPFIFPNPLSRNRCAKPTNKNMAIVPTLYYLTCSRQARIYIRVEVPSVIYGTRVYLGLSSVEKTQILRIFGWNSLIFYEKNYLFLSIFNQKFWNIYKIKLYTHQLTI